MKYITMADTVTISAKLHLVCTSMHFKKNEILKGKLCKLKRKKYASFKLSNYSEKQDSGLTIVVSLQHFRSEKKI